MKNKLILNSVRCFFLIIILITLGICCSHDGKSTSRTYTRYTETHDGYYKNVDHTNDNDGKLISAFGIIGAASLLALGVTFIGKND